jgi:methionyl-tRNA formyltransferase
MKLAPKMDAGPVYVQATLSGLPIEKELLYRELAKVGARMAYMVLATDRNAEPGSLDENERGWLEKVLNPAVQDESKATYCGKMDKSMSLLTPETDTAEVVLRKIIAYQGYPKPKYAFFGVSCIILEAHLMEKGEKAVLEMPCADGQILAIDKLQPEGRKPMDAKSFVNGYGK